MEDQSAHTTFRKLQVRPHPIFPLDYSIYGKLPKSLTHAIIATILSYQTASTQYLLACNRDKITIKYYVTKKDQKRRFSLVSQ